MPGGVMRSKLLTMQRLQHVQQSPLSSAYHRRYRGRRWVTLATYILVPDMFDDSPVLLIVSSNGWSHRCAISMRSILVPILEIPIRSSVALQVWFSMTPGGRTSICGVEIRRQSQRTRFTANPSAGVVPGTRTVATPILTEVPIYYTLCQLLKLRGFLGNCLELGQT